MEDIRIIDVREPDEYATGHYPGAVNITLGKILSADEPLDNLPSSSKIVVYCRSGVRAGQARQALEALGYTDVVNGINADTVDSVIS